MIDRGTRVFWAPGDARRAEGGTGKASGHNPAGVIAPPFIEHYPTLPCTYNPELHQPDGYGPPFTDQIAEAKLVCLACPALTDCRDWAIRMSEPWGIWGATTPPERILARKRAGLPTVRASRYELYDERGQPVDVG